MKKSISILLAAAILIGACVFHAAAAKEQSGQDDAADHPDLLAGDADRDGDVTIMDATKIQRTIAELDEMDEMSQQVAKNEFSAEELTILDATNIQRWLAELFSASTYEVKRSAFVWKNGEYIPITEVYKSTFDAMMKTKEFYGVMYVTRNGRVLYSGAYDEGLGYSIDTKFPVGSMSKQFCAAAIMLLVQDGKLSVDDTLDTFFPEYAYGSQITVRNLLNMRAGITDYFNNATPKEDYDVSEDYPAEQNKKSIKEWLFEQELLDEPDDHFRYSNSNYFLLSLIVEQVSGEDYKGFLRKRIFAPLKMENTGFYEDMTDDPGLAKMRVSILPIETEVKGITQGAGDLVSCAKDMDKWLTSFHTRKLLSEESIREISTPVGGYGFGWNTDKKGILQHDGAISDYLAKDYTDPSINFNIFAATSILDYRKSESGITSIVASAASTMK